MYTKKTVQISGPTKMTRAGGTAAEEAGGAAAREADMTGTAAREVGRKAVGDKLRIQATVAPDMVVSRKAASGKKSWERVATASDTTVQSWCSGTGGSADHSSTRRRRQQSETTGKSTRTFTWCYLKECWKPTPLSNSKALKTAPWLWRNVFLLHAIRI